MADYLGKYTLRDGSVLYGVVWYHPVKIRTKTVPVEDDSTWYELEHGKPKPVDDIKVGEFL